MVETRDDVLEGETQQQRVERLGRQRPERLTSTLREIAFVFVVTFAQLLTEYAAGGFSVLVPSVVRDLDIPPSSITWPASAFSLVVSSFLLPFGRLADIYGGFPIFIFGMVWYSIWALVGGFARNELMLDFCRALQGLGAAAYLPASLNLLGVMYRPGPRKNLVFSIYGAMAPLGFFIGILFSGISAQYISWRWYFFFGAIFSGFTAIVGWWAIPKNHPSTANNSVKMDWLGAFTTSSGLILLIFGITASAHAPQGWATSYIIVTFVLGILLLGSAFYIEGWVAEQPLLPFDVFKINYMRPFILGLLFCYGTNGLYLLYSTLMQVVRSLFQRSSFPNYAYRMQNIMSIAPILVVAYFSPMAIVGILLAIAGGFILHRIPGTIMMFLTGVSLIIMSLLWALAPPNANYWAWIFPAMICATLSIDLIFNVANIFLTTVMPVRRQGLAGALSNVILQLSIAVLLGIADVIVGATEPSQGQLQSYRNAFWFEMACGVAALVVFVGFVRIDSAGSDLTADEKEAMDAPEEEPCTDGTDCNS